MCLLGLVFRHLENYPVLMFDNREEERGRLTEQPAWHAPKKGTSRWFGGQDLRAGGTWLGLNDRGIVVAVTNRKKKTRSNKMRSRGLLCRDLLELDSFDSVLRDAKSEIETNQYDGFNLLLVSSKKGVVLESTDVVKIHELDPGIHVISNGSLKDSLDVRVQDVQAALGTIPANREVPNSAIHNICSAHNLDENSAACRDGENWGTVSSTILRIGGKNHDSNYYYSHGPPCRTAYCDYSQELTEIRF